MHLLKNIKKLIITFLTVAIIFATVCFSISNAFGATNILTIYAGDKKYEVYDFEVTSYNKKQYLKKANLVVDEIYYDTLISPTNSTVKFNKNNTLSPFSFTKSKSGKYINRSKLLSDITYCLNNNIQKINCEFITVNPTISEDLLKSCTLKRGSFTTYFYSSTPERKSNISLANSYISGTILDSGEEFSFNKIVGERTKERGFKDAKIIQNGEYVDGIGGGICQVSSTLYNAVLLSNLKVTSCINHSLLVSYVEPSFDAMVSTYNDLKFINSTPFPIYIQGIVTNNYITFNIYGKENEYEIKRVSNVIEKIKPESPIYIDSNELAFGESKVLQFEKEGLKSEGILEYYKNGERVKTLLIRKDTYKPTQSKILVGSPSLTGYN